MNLLFNFHTSVQEKDQLVHSEKYLCGMKNTALVTGASGGIGLELAREHAKTGGDLILVARSQDKLETIKSDFEKHYKVAVHLIVKDLAEPNAAKEVFDETEKLGLEIEVLINNAGVGEFGHFTDYPLEKDEQMINLNMLELTQFCKLYLPQMVARKSGKILNVASSAAFQPGPTMAVYFATKAYVLHFSEALNNEVKRKGISVTALCPGATDSGFVAAANMEDSKLMKNKKLPTSSAVARYGYKSMMKGKAVAVHGFMNKIMVNSVRFAPRSWVVKLARMLTDK